MATEAKKTLMVYKSVWAKLEDAKEELRRVEHKWHRYSAGEVIDRALALAKKHNWGLPRKKTTGKERCRSSR